MRRSVRPVHSFHSAPSVRPVDTGWGGFMPAHYLNCNTIDPDTDIDGSREFGDLDDEFEGLTIIEPEGVLETARFLNGYNVE